MIVIEIKISTKEDDKHQTNIADMIYKKKFYIKIDAIPNIIYN